MFNLADPVQKMIHVYRIKSRFSHTHTTGSRAMAVRASGHDEPMFFRKIKVFFDQTGFVSAVKHLHPIQALASELNHNLVGNAQTRMCQDGQPMVLVNQPNHFDRFGVGGWHPPPPHPGLGPV